MNKSNLTPWLLLITLAFVWGSSFLLIKYSLVAFSGLQVGLLRLAIAGLTVFPFLIYFAINDKKLLSKEVWAWCFIVGLVGNLLPAILFGIAQTVINSSLAGMLNATQPLFALTLAIIIFKQTIPKVQVFGVLIGFAGAILILTAKTVAIDPINNFKFSLLVVLATFCYGVATNIIKIHLAHVSPIKITALSLGIFMPISAFALLFTDIEMALERESASIALTSIALLAVVGTAMAIFLFNMLIKSSGMLFASSVTYLIPIVAIFWGIVDGEHINVQHIIGMLTVFSGVYLLNKRLAS
jgi:drug/metabolite transporter (DMT)-like permease